MIKPESVFRHRPDLRYRVIEDEAVLVRQEAGELLVLNSTGARLIELIDGTRPVRAIIESMVGEFDAAPSAIEQDVLQFLRELVDLGVTEEVA